MDNWLVFWGDYCYFRLYGCLWFYVDLIFSRWLKFGMENDLFWFLFNLW